MIGHSEKRIEMKQREEREKRERKKIAREEGVDIEGGMENE